MLETARLRLRPFEQDDAEVAFEWFGDPVVMKFISAGADKSIDDTRARIERYRVHQQAHGFSKWIVIDRQSGQPIGDSGLMILPDEGWTDLGFRFAPAYWGKGLATEVGSAWIDVAFNDLGLESLGAFCHVDHVASIEVLRKLGFQPVRETIVMDMPSRIFTLKQTQTTP